LVQDFVRLAKVDGKNGFEYGPQKLKAVLGNDGLKLHHRQSIEELLDAEVNGFLEGGVEKKDGQLAELYTITFAV
jgi:la-related protein 1